MGKVFPQIFKESEEKYEYKGIYSRNIHNKSREKRFRFANMSYFVRNVKTDLFVKNRKTKKEMNKCDKCKNCSNAEKCDKFYIHKQSKATLTIGKRY